MDDQNKFGFRGTSVEFKYQLTSPADGGGGTALYFEPADPAYTPSLAIWSGSSSSADIPAPPVGVPLMMGEHVTLGNRADRAGKIGRAHV